MNAIFIAAFLAYFFLFWRHLFFYGAIPFHSDTLRLYFPSWAIGKRLFADGFFFLWEPFRNMGQPFLASPQNQALYPVRLLGIILDYINYNQFFVFFHVSLATFFGYLVGKLRFKDNLPGIFLALVFGFSGLMWGRVVYPAELATLAWMPVLIYLFYRRRPLLMGIALGLQWMAGFPPLFILGVLFLFLLGIFEKNRREALKISGVATLVGVGLAAVQILPFLEMLRHSGRALFLEGAASLENSLSPWVLLSQLVCPSILIREVLPPFHYVQSFFVGPVCTGLVVYALWKNPRQGRALLFIGAIGLVLALGRYNGFYGGIPVFRVFRYPSSWLALAVPALALLGAFGLSMVKNRRIKWLLVFLLAFDLFVFAHPGYFLWAGRNLFNMNPVGLHFIEEAPQNVKGRLSHTEAIITGNHDWDMRNPRTTRLLKKALVPSLGAAYGYHEVGSHHNLTSQRNLDFRARLDTPGSDLLLKYHAGIEKMISLKPGVNPRELPKENEFVVEHLPLPHHRAFLVESDEKVDVILDKPGRIHLKTTGPGHLVLSESFDQGWKVRVNGKKATLEEFKETFPSVKLKEGEFLIQFTYRPGSFILGLIITLMTLCLVLFQLRFSMSFRSFWKMRAWKGRQAYQ